MPNSTNELVVKQERWGNLDVSVVGINSSGICISQNGFAIVVEKDNLVTLIEALQVAKIQVES